MLGGTNACNQIINFLHPIDSVNRLERMNLNQIIAFREVMLTGSVSEAARNLNRTQPSISHMIATLERDLDMKLFERRGGRLHPVAEANYLFEECKELLRRLQTIDQTMQRIKAKDSGELRIVSMPGPSVVLLPETIADFLPTGAEAKATLLSRSSDAVIQLVSTQQFDLGVADYDPNTAIEGSLVSSEVFDFDLLCAVPHEDPLAARDILSPTDLNEKPLAVLFDEHPTRRETQRVFESANRRLNVRYVAQYFLPLLTYVERALAYALVDPLAADSWRRCRPTTHQSVVFVPFSPVVAFGVALLTPTYRPASILSNAFKDHFVAELMRLGAQPRGNNQMSFPPKTGPSGT